MASSCQSQASLSVVQVQGIRDLTPNLYLLDLAGFPETFRPHAGQFLHLRVSREDHPLLRRPISIQSWDRDSATLLIREVGLGTQILHRCRPGDSLDVLGPLGTSFPAITAGDSVLMVGGGVGVAPLLACCSEAHSESEIDFCFGLATAAEIQGLEPFKDQKDRIRFHVSTDDGSAGFKGFCTQLAERLLGERPYTRIFTCGPWIMMHKAHLLGQRFGVPVFASLEVQMGCGLGACLGCVYETPGGDFIRSCIDGPVVDAAGVVWERE